MAGDRRGEHRRAHPDHRFAEWQYSNPARIMAFNTAEGWSQDVLEELAEEIARRCAAEGFDFLSFLESFVDR
jgi:hypothetical protein